MIFSWGLVIWLYASIIQFILSFLSFFYLQLVISWWYWSNLCPFLFIISQLDFIEVSFLVKLIVAFLLFENPIFNFLVFWRHGVFWRISRLSHIFVLTLKIIRLILTNKNLSFLSWYKITDVRGPWIFLFRNFDIQ